MSIFEPAAQPWPDRFLAMFRFVACAVFISVGTMKLFGYPPSPVQMPPFKLMSEMGIAGILEVFGGLLVLIGFLTRPVSFILAGEMAVAYFQGHFPTSFFPSINQGIPAILYCFFFLYLMVAGPGAWSVDRALAVNSSQK